MSIDQDTEVAIRTRLVRSIRQHTGLDERIAVEMAGEAYRALIDSFRQERIYVSPSKRARNEAVRREFNGRNHSEVMAKHRISKRTLYRILNEKRDAARQVADA